MPNPQPTTCAECGAPADCYHRQDCSHFDGYYGPPIDTGHLVRIYDYVPLWAGNAISATDYAPTRPIGS